jgi:hypothetical protein
MKYAILALVTGAFVLAAGTAMADPLQGEWVGRPTSSFDTTTLHRLEVQSDGSKVTGALIVTTTMPVRLSSWIDRFCDGNDVLEQVVRYRVSGVQAGSELSLQYSGPRIESCTCSDKCVVKDKGGRATAIHNSATRQMIWEGITLYPAAVAGQNEAAPEQVVQPADVPVDGSWATTPSTTLDMTISRLLDLQEVGGVLTGTYAERTTRPFPLASWRDRFCGGSDAWNAVEIYEVKGHRQRDQVTLTAKNGRIASCSCPQKCRASTRGIELDLRVTADGREMRSDLGTFTRTLTPVADPPVTPAGPAH